jgi:hypothetical protein
MDIAILRKKPEDRIRTVHPFKNADGADDATIAVDVLFLGDDGLQAISQSAEALIKEGDDRETAFRKAYGRIAVQGWRGLADGDQDLPLSEANADLLMTQSAEFRQAVITAATSLRRGAEKNS